MTLLLDTHTVLWYWWDHPSLSKTAKRLIEDPANQKLLSPATPWEVAVKVSLRKLDIGGPNQGFFPYHMAQAGFDYIPVNDDHLSALAGMPFHRRDPFDRLLLAQVMVEGMPVVSADVAFDPYGVTRLW